MATTQLSVTALPGKPHSFSPKAEAVPESGPHTGTFTELSVTATPGSIHSFSPKDAAVPESGPHTGLFTELSVLSLPGRRHSFSAKTEAAAALASPWFGSRGYYKRRQEKDILELITIILSLGLLDDG